METELDAEFARVTTHFGKDLIGFLAIGSRAKGEAVSRSDHDIRVVIQTDTPYVVFDDRQWSPPPAIDVRPVEWGPFGQNAMISFGFTNLGYIEKCLESNYFPLADHMALFQGRVVVDATGAISQFRHARNGIVFPNVVADYIRQTEWRVTNRLKRELDPASFYEKVDHNKQAIPALHTICRITTDMAQIDSYRATGQYLKDVGDVVRYYEMNWPAYYEQINQAYRKKTNELERRQLYERAVARNADVVDYVVDLAAKIEALWREFRSRSQGY